MAREGEADGKKPGSDFEFDVELGRRHIIKRPRLTRLLDESKSKIIMLVAPAGYGKTTLAREWLEDKPHAWYQATNASADVAALAAGIADAVGAFVPGAPARLRERLRVSDAPQEEVSNLVRAFAEQLTEWPQDAWLVIDDYHLLASSTAAEEFISLLQSTSLQLLLTARRRPRWASARRILYGEVFEIGRNLLAMTYEEGHAVLLRAQGKVLPGILALAEGWPAVLGLAALSSKGAPPDRDLPATLYEYFAEEVYQSASARLHEDIHYLALIPRVTTEAVESVFGTQATALLEECSRLGLLTYAEAADVHLHPLLRRFLSQKIRNTHPREPVLEGLCGYYQTQGEWDNALEVAAHSAKADLLIATFEAAYEDLVAQSRLHTLTRWIAEAADRGIQNPIIELASAEIALRQGHLHKALALAEHSAIQFAPKHRHLPRAYRLAALAASRCDMFDRAYALYSVARDVAIAPDDQWQATWGLFISTVSLEAPAAQQTLTDLLQFSGGSPELALRQAAAPYLYGSRFGSLHGTLTPLKRAEHLLEQATDPLARSAFLNFYAHRLVLGADYDAASAIIARQIEEVQQYGIRFALAVGLATRAAIEFGQRNLTIASSSLDTADSLLETLSGGSHIAMNSMTLRARIALARGRADEALHLLDREWEHLPEPAMVGEYTATRALAMMCAGKRKEALALAEEASGITRGVEAHVLAEAVRASASLSTHNPSMAVSRFLETVRDTENFDGFVSAYRAHPPLLAAVRNSSCGRNLLDLVRRYDRDLARRMGLIDVAGKRDSKLSKREREVFALVRQGMTDREIARTLFISESTAKVHLRHILEKLGARSRTEAVAMGLLDEVD